MALTDVIGSFKTGPGTYTVTRTTDGGHDSKGRAVAGSASTFEITASVQPMSGRDVQLLPEGYHGKETQKLYTTTALVAVDASNEPDEVSIGGENWKVIMVKHWEAFGSDHYKAILSRELVSS